MSTKLTKEQIETIVERERDRLTHSYKDDVDETIDRVVNLYENKQINEELFKAVVSFTILNATKDTVSDLTNDLVRKNLNLQFVEQNKIFLLNYSKKNYA